MHTKNEFKYARLFDEQTGKYYTDGTRTDLTMGPETRKRFEENDDDCAVTICCITYKHEDYIRTALDSFLMQKTNFKFKIFVGEDCGPDGTADIVREYAEKYPDIIVPFLREENMGAPANLIDLCNHADSPYIAFCEGDDYWIDEYKLQKQYDYMQKHEELRMCFTRTKIEAPEDWYLRSYYKTNKNGEMIMPETFPGFKMPKRDLTAQDCVSVIPMHTSSQFYRWNYDIEYPEWFFGGLEGAFPILMMQLGKGRGGFIPDITSVYRRSEVGGLMHENWTDHFLKTRMDYFRFLMGVRDYFIKNYDSYCKVALENRVRAEGYNLLSNALKIEDDEAIQQFAIKYPEAFHISLNAYLSFYRDSRALINAFSWRGYKAILSKRYYRYPLKIYSYIVLGAEKLRKIIKEVLKKGYNFLGFLAYWFYTPVPKRKNLWVITSFRGHKYLDNAKYLYEYIIENNPEIELYWLTKDDEVYSQLKEDNKPVYKFGTGKSRKILSHAEVAITDHNVMSDYDRLSGINNRTKIVQLWHGVGFKAMGDGKVVKTVSEPGVVYSNDILPDPSDSPMTKLKKRIKYFFAAPFREKFEKYFIFVCPGQERLDMIADVWNIPRESCFMAGHPRNILMYSMQPDDSAPVIMYAPTFRYSPEKEAELIDACLDSLDKIEALMEKINGTFLIRLHPHTWRNYSHKILHCIKDYDRIRYDDEPDIYTKMGAYSIVITDYSSISLDFAMLNRPAIYYCPDIVWFRETQAGFNLDFENSIPGPMTFSWDETLDCVAEYIENPQKDINMRTERIQYFFDMSVNGPDNSERITNEIKRRLGI